jgi:glucokinase
MKKKVAIGLDIGGTKIKAGIVDADGRIYGIPITIPTTPNAPSEIIINRIFVLLEEIRKKTPNVVIQGIGIGCTGPVDCRQGIILDVANLPTLNNFPLKAVLEQRFSLQVTMDNDANAMILGESVWGAGCDSEVILGITLGTGLGCAWVINNCIWHGYSECAGEIWTSPYKDGIIEEYVSGHAITRLYKEYAQVELPAQQIADLARTGDKSAIRVWNIFAETLAYTLAWTVNMCDPQKVVIGGSIIKAADLYWGQMLELFHRHICRSTAQVISVVPAALGDDAGFMGAAALILKQ